MKTLAEEFSPSKRKAWALEDSKQHRKSSQKRRLLDSEESDGDEKAGHSSRGTRIGVSLLPRLIDDNTFRTLDMVPQLLLSGAQEKCWATLNLRTLRLIFRRLGGDVRSLFNASATCKSWMAAGKIHKTELKSVDISSLRGSRLDAVLEALPVIILLIRLEVDLQFTCIANQGLPLVYCGHSVSFILSLGYSLVSWCKIY